MIDQEPQSPKLIDRAGRHTFLHFPPFFSGTTHLLEDGYHIRSVQDLLEHKDVRTTMIYTHLLNRGGRGVKSPVDAERVRLKPYKTQGFGANGYYALSRKKLC